jgi:hypothetical protein
MQMDLASVVELCKALPEFGAMRVVDGHIRVERSFKVTSLQDLENVLNAWQKDENIEVNRFPDGWKITFSRMVRSS